MTIFRITLPIFILLFTICVSKSYGQDEEFIMLADSEMVHLHYEFGGGGAGIKILKYPDEIMGMRPVIQNLSKGCSGGIMIEGNQFWAELDGCYSGADTFVVYLISQQTELPYPAEVITPGSSSGIIILGANSNRLNCVPKNNPWMPTAYDPFLFPKNGYYINPDNGKIQKGSRQINSGIYNSCDLKYWKYISPYGLYADKKGNRYRGSDLIAKGRINLKDWNLDVFGLFQHL